MWINSVERKTLELIVEKLSKINEDHTLNEIINFLTEIININQSSSTELLNYASRVTLRNCIKEKIRGSLLQLYKSRERTFFNSEFHSNLYSVLIALAVYWPQNSIVYTPSTEHWLVPICICPLTNCIVDPDNAMLLMSGHTIDRKKFLETRASDNDVKIMSHPFEPGLFEQQDHELNFDSKYSKGELKQRARDALKSFSPPINFRSLIDIAYVSFIPTVVTGLIALFAISFLAASSLLTAPLTAVLIVSPILIGVAVGSLIGLAWNKIRKNELKRELVKEIDKDTEKTISLTSSFVDSIKTARKTIFDQIRQDTNAQASSSASITRQLQNAVRHQSVEENIIQPVTGNCQHAELVDFTLSIIDPAQPDQPPTSQETIQMYVPRFRSLG